MAVPPFTAVPPLEELGGVLLLEQPTATTAATATTATPVRRCRRLLRNICAPLRGALAHPCGSTDPVCGRREDPGKGTPSRGGSGLMAPGLAHARQRRTWLAGPRPTALLSHDRTSTAASPGRATTRQ